MKMVEKLSQLQRQTILPRLVDQLKWQQVSDRDALKKTFLFPAFSEAFAFMTRVALMAEKLDHHPEWFNVYNRVEVLWSTHDCQGLSEKDVKMIEFCEQVAQGLQEQSTSK